MHIIKSRLFFLKTTECFMQNLPEVIKITRKMPYKVHISEINVLGYLQRAAMLKILIITMLEIILSLLPKVPIESRFWVDWKKLPTRLNNTHEKTYANGYVWSDGMGSQSRYRYIFKLLVSKGPMDGIGEMVKNVILIKVKSSQLVVHSPLEAVAKFVPSIHSVYLPENENRRRRCKYD